MQKNDIIVGFDFDGVIVNSLSVMEKSWSELCDKYNINIPFSAYKKNIGLKFNIILENIGVDKYLFEAVHKDYFRGTNYYKNDILLYPEVMQTFESLKEKDVSTFIITSKPRANTLSLLEIFGIRVELLVCADDVIQGKPHPESGFQVNKKFGNKPVYYVGDMDCDRQFAENCNFNFIYASYGYGDLSKKATHKIGSLSEVLDILNI